MAGRLKIWNASTSSWDYAGNGLPGLLKGSGSTAAQGSITTVADLVGSTVTFTADGVSTYLVLYTNNTTSTVADDVGLVRLLEGASILDSCAVLVSIASRASSSMSFYTVVPTAGAHTYKLAGIRNNGTGTLTMTSKISVFLVG